MTWRVARSRKEEIEGGKGIMNRFTHALHGSFAKIDDTFGQMPWVQSGL